MTDEVLKCSKCGKDCTEEFRAKGERLLAWGLKNPDRAICDECRNSGGASKAKKGGKPEAKGNTQASGKRGEIDAKALRKAYDEVCAEFADVLPDVKEFLGGWTTTIALSNAKK